MILFVLSFAETMLQYDDVDEDVLRNYHEFSLANIIFYGMKESACSEQSARMTAMDNATKNAGRFWLFTILYTFFFRNNSSNCFGFFSWQIILLYNDTCIFIARAADIVPKSFWTELQFVANFSHNWWFSPLLKACM